MFNLNTALPSVLLLLTSVLLASVSQLLLKKAAHLGYSGLRTYLNIWVAVGYSLLFLSLFVTMLALRQIPLSLAPIIESSAYLCVALLSKVFLHEQIGRRRWLGLGLIITGIVIACL